MHIRCSSLISAGILLAVILVFLFGTPTPAQTKTPTLDVGTVSLSLGIPREKVLRQLTQAGYKVIDQPPQGSVVELIVTSNDTDDPAKRAVALIFNEGHLYFRGGMLIKIQTSIRDEFHTDRDLATALYAIFRQNEREVSNGLLCSVGTSEDTSVLSVDAHQIGVTCILGAGVFRTTTIRWATTEGLQSQLHVRVFQELWRKSD